LKAPELPVPCKSAVSRFQPDARALSAHFAVDDIAATSKRIEAAGGGLIGSSHTIPTVGELAQFADTEGNEAIIIQYAPQRLKEMGLA